MTHLGPIQLASNFSAAIGKCSNYSLEGKQQKQLSSQNKHYVSDWRKQKQRQTCQL